MSHFGLYMYPYNNEVTLGNFNMPFSTKTMTIYKGINNVLSFTIHNADGKYTKIKDTESLIFKLYDLRSDTIIYDVVLESYQPSWVSESGMARPTLGNKAKVYYSCVVPAGVIQDLSTGSKYRWSIEKVDLSSNIELVQLLYTGLNYQAQGEVIISNNASPTFVPSYIIGEGFDESWTSVNSAFTFDIAKDYVGEFDIVKTSSIPSSASYGLVDAMSTIALKLEDFKGRIQLQACLNNDAPKDAEEYKWFTVKLTDEETGEEFDYLDSNDDPEKLLNIFKYFNFKGNYMWVRVIALIEPIIVERNDRYSYKKTYRPMQTIKKIYIRR